MSIDYADIIKEGLEEIRKRQAERQTYLDKIEAAMVAAKAEGKTISHVDISADLDDLLKPLCYMSNGLIRRDESLPTKTIICRDEVIKSKTPDPRAAHTTDARQGKPL